jgi:hypothetical protein
MGARGLVPIWNDIGGFCEPVHRSEGFTASLCQGVRHDERQKGQADDCGRVLQQPTLRLPMGLCKRGHSGNCKLRGLRWFHCWVLTALQAHFGTKLFEQEEAARSNS